MEQNKTWKALILDAIERDKRVVTIQFAKEEEEQIIEILRRCGFEVEARRYRG